MQSLRHILAQPANRHIGCPRRRPAPANTPPDASSRPANRHAIPGTQTDRTAGRHAGSETHPHDTFLRDAGTLENGAVVLYARLIDNRFPSCGRFVPEAQLHPPKRKDPYKNRPLD